jgi:hypothetical protein
MRSLLTGLILSGAVLGLMTAAPAEAKAQAQWPTITVSHRFGGYGTLNVYGVPAYQWFNNMPWGAGQMIYSPGAYRTVMTPNSISQLWFGPSSSTVTYNPCTGINVQSTTPAITGYMFNPYTGLRPVMIPSLNYNSGFSLNTGLGFSSLGSPFTGGLASAFNVNTGLGFTTVVPMSQVTSIAMPGGGVAVMPVGRASRATSMLPSNATDSGLKGPAAYNSYIPANLIVK